MKLIILFMSLAYAIPSMAYFYPRSYTESRLEFKKVISVLKAATGYKELSLPVPSKKKEPLFIDGLFLEAEQTTKEHLLIVTSGIHGVEAFTGAAIQIEFLKNYIKNRESYKNTSLLFLHGINPYGFHFNRRVDENNIDLNRNFSATEKEFHKKIPQYEDFESFVNPKSPAATGFWPDTQLFLKSLTKLVTHGKKQIAQIAVGGQYQNPKGIYYGGQARQNNSALVEQTFRQYGSPYKKILHIDLHTGFGKRGILHFFSSKKITALDGFDAVFKDFPIDTGSDDDFYETSGDFSSLTLEVFKDKELVIPMTFEFGTMDSQTIMGGFFSLKNLIYENQGFQYGFQSTADEKKIKQDFMEMFNPSDLLWRDQVVSEGSKTLETVAKRFSNL